MCAIKTENYNFLSSELNKNERLQAIQKPSKDDFRILLHWLTKKTIFRPIQNSAISKCGIKELKGFSERKTTEPLYSVPPNGILRNQQPGHGKNNQTIVFISTKRNTPQRKTWTRWLAKWKLKNAAHHQELHLLIAHLQFRTETRYRFLSLSLILWQKKRFLQVPQMRGGHIRRMASTASDSDQSHVLSMDKAAFILIRIKKAFMKKKKGWVSDLVASSCLLSSIGFYGFFFNGGTGCFSFILMLIVGCRFLFGNFFLMVVCCGIGRLQMVVPQ